MTSAEPGFTLGIEEEYLLVDRETLDLASAPDGLLEDCVAELGDKVNPEFLRCQIEIGTGVCKTIAEAREDLAHLRRTVARIAGEHGCAPLAVSTHPTADWDEQRFTDKERYRELEEDLAAVARRMLICGMHVHVGIEDDDLRIDLMNQFSYFLPHLLALSTSSPFWGGRNTGLKSYRLTVFDNMPRTGIPPTFSSFSEYSRAAGILIDTGLIEDCTKIWWDVRPSEKFPTVESRICDVLPTVREAIGVAALTQSLFRFLFFLRAENKQWRQYDRFLIAENRWRAQRYGVSESLIDFGKGELVPYGDLLDELIAFVRPHAEALGCLGEVEGLRDVVKSGTGADRQLATFSRLRGEGADEREALRGVIRMLIDEFTEGL
ncbi:carboxylate-amine ligase [Jiella mangrovi]|uniref:Putative glutamate--cysteine ligase 2 n=1 Tax=Jiella mangrovi TaxID=2821407 RepID=A0ABS4BF39_9HYPH|nr:carboxylate-amine ligase [Jiella mangrovi]MBP0614644.1 carboxylate-amine ligase [Jiella mangrovi]